MDFMSVILYICGKETLYKLKVSRRPWNEDSPGARPCQYEVNFQCFEKHLWFHHRNWQRRYLRNTVDVFHTNIEDSPKRLHCMRTFIRNLCKSVYLQMTCRDGEQLFSYRKVQQSIPKHPFRAKTFSIFEYCIFKTRWHQTKWRL
jgi:hypothetical protein